MNNQTASIKQRETWGDVIRGICSLTVILSHIPGSPHFLLMYVTPFTLPCFFILSGYFTKNYGGNLTEFFYNKVLKEVLIKLMFCACMTTLTLQVIARLILHPTTIPEWLYDTFLTFLAKPTANFFSILVMCSIYFIVVNKICRDKPIPMILISFGMAAVGYLIARERIIKLWSWDTALVCVAFYTLGYCARQNGVIKKFKWKPEHALISGGVFFALVTFFAMTFGVKHTMIIVGNNTFVSPLVSVPLFLAGNIFMIALANVIPKTPRPIQLLMYIGRHSMIYFMIGGLVLAYTHYFHTLLFEAFHWSFLQSLVYKLPVYLIVTASITLISSYLSDRFFPALNGCFRLPESIIKRRPKTCIAVCVLLILTGAGVLTASLKGFIIPNQVYARHYPVHGVDVSSYQGHIDWQQLASQDVRFAFIKATEGSGHVDSCFANNWREVSETEIVAGAYHFFSFETSGRTQAENFISVVPVSENALPPVVDLEYYGDYDRNPLPAEKIVPELKTLLDALQEHYGKRPIIYVTEPSYLQYIYTYFDDYDIWLRYVVTDPPEGDWRFWQYTDRAKLNGYDGEEEFIDMNVFLGDEEQWKNYIDSHSSDSAVILND